MSRPAKNGERIRPPCRPLQESASAVSKQTALGEVLFIGGLLGDWPGTFERLIGVLEKRLYRRPFREWRRFASDEASPTLQSTPARPHSTRSTPLAEPAGQ